MKTKQRKWMVLGTIVSAISVCLLIYLKTPTYARALTETYGGLYSPTYDSERGLQKLTESLIGDCKRFDVPASICISNDMLTDEQFEKFGPFDSINNICLESNRLTDNVLIAMKKNRPFFMTIASKQLTDEAVAASAEIRSLVSLTLVSDSITGESISDLSSLPMLDIVNLASDNLDHRVISQSTFSEHLRELMVVGPPIDAMDYKKYASNLPEDCILRVSSPLPDISGLEESSKRIKLVLTDWVYSEGDTCNCSVISERPE